MSGLQMEALDFRYLLLEYYKRLGLNENELSVLLMIDHFLNQKNNLITPDLLCMKMSLSIKELDDIFVVLMGKGFLIFETGKNIKVSLKPLKKQLMDLFEEDITKNNENKNNKYKSETLENLFSTFEKEYARTLSPLEKTVISEWVEHGYKPDQIIDALNECLLKNKKTLKSVDKLLLQWQTRDDIEETGLTSSSDKWDKNIEETLKIARAKWIDD